MKRSTQPRRGRAHARFAGLPSVAGRDGEWIAGAAGATILPHCIRVEIPANGELSSPARQTSPRNGASRCALAAVGALAGYTVSAFFIDDEVGRGYYLLSEESARVEWSHMTPVASVARVFRLRLASRLVALAARHSSESRTVVSRIGNRPSAVAALRGLGIDDVRLGKNRRGCPRSWTRSQRTGRRAARRHRRAADSGGDGPSVRVAGTRSHACLRS